VFPDGLTYVRETWPYPQAMEEMGSPCSRYPRVPAPYRRHRSGPGAGRDRDFQDEHFEGITQ